MTDYNRALERWNNGGRESQNSDAGCLIAGGEGASGYYLKIFSITASPISGVGRA
jgi:hypothetical protein